MTFQEAAPEVNENQTKLVYSELIGMLPRNRTDITGYHEDFVPEQLTRITVANRTYNQALADVKAVLEEYFGVKGNYGDSK